MPQRYLAGIAHEQVQAKRHDGKDARKRQHGDIVGLSAGENQGHRNNNRGKDGVFYKFAAFVRHGYFRPRIPCGRMNMTSRKIENAMASR